MTAKHKRQQEATDQQQLKTPSYFSCVCGKQYKDRTGLWRRKKKCKYDEDNKQDDKDIFSEE